MDTTLREYSMEEFNALIDSIKKAHSLNEEDITRRVKYNEGYISQSRSRGKVSAKFVHSLMREFGITDITIKKPIKEDIGIEPGRFVGGV